MEIKVLEKIESPLLKRTKIIAEVLYPGAPTPKRGDVRKLLAAQLGAEEALVVVRQLEPTFGPKAKLTALQYKDRAQLESIEQKHIIGREKGQKVKPTGKTKAAGPAKK